MRYSIRFPILLQCCDELEQIARRHIREIEALRQTRRSLARLSGMEAVLEGIDRELAGMEEQRRVLLVMAQVVRRAHQIYTDTENTVIDEADCPDRPLTELRFTGDGGVAGSGPLWQVSDAAPGSAADAALTVGQLDVRTYAVLLSDMNVVLRAAW